MIAEISGLGLSSAVLRNLTVQHGRCIMTLIPVCRIEDIRSIAIDGSGNKWIGTDGGLAKFNSATWTAYATSNSGLPNNYILSIAKDSSGNKWIGTVGSGLAKFDGTTWTTYSTSNSGLPDNGLRL